MIGQGGLLLCLPELKGAVAVLSGPTRAGASQPPVDPGGSCAGRTHTVIRVTASPAAFDRAVGKPYTRTNGLQR
jgi:hypothetical protein